MFFRPILSFLLFNYLIKNHLLIAGKFGNSTNYLLIEERLIGWILL